jgi:hypothetical protein
MIDDRENPAGLQARVDLFEEAIPVDPGMLRVGL